MTNERDTHFANAAKLLYEQLAQHSMSEFGEQVDTVRFMREQRTIIAQFAYDLLDHASQFVLVSPEDVPDLTEWPNTSPEAP